MSDKKVPSFPLLRDIGDKTAPVVICFVTGGMSHNWALIDQELADNGLRVVTFSARFTMGAPYESAWDGDKDTAHFFGEMAKAYDPAGPDFDAPYSFSDCVADFKVVMEQLGVKKAAVLGFSTGGMMAQLAITAFPDCVTCGVCCSSGYDPNAVGENLDEVKEKIAKNMARMANAPKAVSGDEASVVANRLALMGAMMDAEEPESEDPRAPYLTERAKDDFALGLVDYVGMGEPRSALAWALWTRDKGLEEHHRRMETNTVPTLLVHGKADPLVPFSEAAVLHKHFANSTLVAHEFGHILGPADSQKRLAAKIAGFIKMHATA
eukprot:CAMPEP_0173439366 /NCGR_PEP_ID=MMETSP1357-20121228/20910_1 /TAXON_ID=77926 /ORGANISM="Hemiselmis rufescens, Strain PCC563" /LENGTH=322 /DNA_ID=CAMNT_0014404727 /DNA_START=128 /DNA_END=1096 /DNA_ORIENTATION=+